LVLLTGCFTFNVQTQKPNSPTNPEPSPTATELQQADAVCPENELTGVNAKLSYLLERDLRTLNQEKSVELWDRLIRSGSFQKINAKKGTGDTVVLSFVSRDFPDKAVTEAVVEVSYFEQGNTLCFDLSNPKQDAASIQTMKKFLDWVTPEKPLF
jgi:hypothetical protein